MIGERRFPADPFASCPLVHEEDGQGPFSRAKSKAWRISHPILSVLKWSLSSCLDQGRALMQTIGSKDRPSYTGYKCKRSRSVIPGSA